MNSIGGVAAMTTYKVEGMAARNLSVLDATSQAPKRALTTTLTIQFDKVTQQPILPRFPWLSRLTAELEAAAKQRPTFPPTSALGNNIDKTA